VAIPTEERESPDLIITHIFSLEGGVFAPTGSGHDHRDSRGPAPEERQGPDAFQVRSSGEMWAMMRSPDSRS
jgi:hypothetical protein